MAQPDIDIEVWAEEEYFLPNAQTINKIRPINDLWRKGYDMGEKPDVQTWNYIWNMLSRWVKYMQEEQIPELGDLYLKRTGNLSELQDLVASRNTLQVYSKQEVNDELEKYLPLTGGVITGGLKIAGTTGVADTSPGLVIRHGLTAGAGIASFVNNRGDGITGGFVFRCLESDSTESGRVTIQKDGSLVTTATVQSGHLVSTGDATVAGTTQTATLNVTSQGATVGGRNVVRSVNAQEADGDGNVTISFPAQGVMGIRMGPLQSFRERGGTEHVPGGVMTSWADTGTSNYWVYLRPLQYLINGSWVTVAYT